MKDNIAMALSILYEEYEPLKKEYPSINFRLKKAIDILEDLL